jgi:hypothetical protein
MIQQSDGKNGRRDGIRKELVMKEGDIVEVMQYKREGMFVKERWIPCVVLRVWDTKMRVQPVDKSLWKGEPPPELDLPFDQCGHMWR